MAIVASNHLVRKELFQLIGKHLPEWKVVWEARSISSAKRLLACSSPDVLVLDSHLSDGADTDLLKFLPLNRYNMILLADKGETTKVVEHPAVAVLKKPIEKNSLCEALEKLGPKVPASDLSPSSKPNMHTLLHKVAHEPEPLQFSTQPTPKISNPTLPNNSTATSNENKDERSRCFPLPW